MVDLNVEWLILSNLSRAAVSVGDWISVLMQPPVTTDLLGTLLGLFYFLFFAKLLTFKTNCHHLHSLCFLLPSFIKQMRTVLTRRKNSLESCGLTFNAVIIRT